MPETGETAARSLALIFCSWRVASLFKFLETEKFKTTDGKGDNFTRLTFPTGEAIIKEGDFGEAAYVIVEGKVEIRIGHFRKKSTNTGNPDKR